MTLTRGHWRGGTNTAARLITAFLFVWCGACGVEPPLTVIVRAQNAPMLASSPAAAVPTDLSSARIFARHDLVVRDGVEAALASAGLSRRVADELDDALIGRIDVFAHLQKGATFTVWTDDAGRLVAAHVPLGRNESIIAARYDGALAPHGFYDDDGRSTAGAIRARPVHLHRITSRFGQRFDAIDGSLSMHHGVDYGVPVGTPVFAVGRARVKQVGHSASAGNFVELTHEAGFESLYLHLSEIEPGVRVGAIVEAGQAIARSGNTGRSTGPHLHYELHLDGTALDPLATLPPPTVALGPLARREHVAFINSLEAMP